MPEIADVFRGLRHLKAQVVQGQRSLADAAPEIQRVLASCPMETVRGAHSGAESLLSWVSEFSFEGARDLVRAVVRDWKARGGFSWKSCGGASHCYLWALVLSGNVDLADDELVAQERENIRWYLRGLKGVNDAGKLLYLESVDARRLLGGFLVLDDGPAYTRASGVLRDYSDAFLGGIAHESLLPGRRNWCVQTDHVPRYALTHELAGCDQSGHYSLLTFREGCVTFRNANYGGRHVEFEGVFSIEEFLRDRLSATQNAWIAFSCLEKDWSRTLDAAMAAAEMPDAYSTVVLVQDTLLRHRRVRELIAGGENVIDRRRYPDG